MFSIQSILKEVKTNGYWDSDTYIHKVSEDDSSVIMECLLSHNLWLGVSKKGNYVLENRTTDVSPLTRNDLRTLLSGSVRDCSSFAHFVNEVFDIKQLRKIPVRFSIEQYSTDALLQRAVDVIMCQTSYIYGTCIGLCIRNGSFVLLKTEKIDYWGQM